MVDVISKGCRHEGCKTRPIYNYENETKRFYCSEHKKVGMVGMVDVKNKMCTLCPTRVHEKYDGYCLRCYVYTIPHKPRVSRNYKLKDTCVVDFVKDKFPNVSWTTDKQVNDGCSLRRPDILLHFGDQVLIIEIDENEHTSYDCSCENKRIMQLSQDVGHRPIVIIRFNPDSYKKVSQKYLGVGKKIKKITYIILSADEGKAKAALTWS
jgi:hypothetical protein